MELPMKFEPDQVDKAIQYLLANKADLGSIEIKMKNTRTLQQSKARWLWLTGLANHLNERGIGIIALLKILKKNPNEDKPCTPEEVYDAFWSPIHTAVSGKDIGKKLDAKEFSEAIELATRYAANKFDYSAEFPDRRG
jgi:hypothetical protein